MNGRRQKMRMIAALAVAFGGLCAPRALAQGSRKDDIVLNGQGRPMAGVTVRICTSAATGQPCTPLASIYSDVGLTQPLANPLTTDGLGNYSFFATPGQYEIEISGQSIATKQMPNVVLPSDPNSPTFTTVTTTGNLTVNGSAAVTGSLTVGGGAVPTTGAANVWTANQTFKGPIPWADVTAFGGRSVVNQPTTTATCTATNTSVPIGAAVAFQNGDGVTLYGCGANTGMSTPSAPTVTPSIATGGTGLGGGSTGSGITVASGTGSSNYSYEIIARDKFGGYTAPSAATSISTGLSALGLTNCTISTISRSNDSVTVNFSSSCAGAVTGAMVHITGTTSAEFTGWYGVSSHSGATQITLNSTSIDTRGNGLYWTDVTSATGGNAAFYLSNHLSWSVVTGAWEYYVCAERPGDVTYKLIGQTRPSANSWVDVQFDDYGSPYMDSQTYPSYITNALCNGGSASADPLTTTIVSGGGSSTLVLANAPSNNSSGQKIVFDDGPAIVAAANSISSGSVRGTLYFPASTGTLNAAYFVESYTTLTSVSVKQVGKIDLFETLELGNNVNWDGNDVNYGGFSLTFGGAAVINSVAANPAIYISGNGPVLYNLQIQSPQGTNGGTLMVFNAPVGSYFYGSRLMFQPNSGGSSDYLSTNFVSESTGADTEIHLDHCSFTVGPSQSTDNSWSPSIYFPPLQNGSGGLLNNEYNIFSCNDCTYNRRGIEQEMVAGNGGQWEFINGHRQGGITPFLLFGNSNGGSNAYVHIDNLLLDTETVGVVASVGYSGGSVSPDIDATLLLDGSSEPGSVQIPPPFSGHAPSAVRIMNSTVGRIPNMSGCGVANNTNPFVNLCALPQPQIGPNAYIYWPIAPPTNVSGTAAGGGSLANKTWQGVVTAVGADGRESAPSQMSAGVATSGGNNEINFTWNASTGAVSYNFYQCGNVTACQAGTNGNINTAQVTTGITGTSYTFSAEANGSNPPRIGTTGQTAASSSGMFGQKFECAEDGAPSGVTNADLSYCDSTAHRWKDINNNGTALLRVGISAAGASGNLPKFAANGIDVSDSGIAAPTTGTGVVSVNATPTVVTIGSGTSISATSLCSTSNCPAGDYDVAVYIDITTACATTGTYIVWLGWTDDAGAKTGSSTTTFIPINGNGVTQSTGSLALASTTNYGQGHHYIHTTGAATGGLGSINYGTTATACGSGGPMIGNMYLDVTRIR